MLALTVYVLPAQADDAADVDKVLGDMADALSGGEATQAMSAFSKTYPDYDKLSAYFDALTSAFKVENRLEFKEEDVAATQASLNVQWDLALTTGQSGFTTNRSAEVKVKLVREGKHWRITEFAPITIFDPQGQ